MRRFIVPNCTPCPPATAAARHSRPDSDAGFFTRHPNFKQKPVSPLPDPLNSQPHFDGLADARRPHVLFWRIKAVHWSRELGTTLPWISTYDGTRMLKQD
ncbi:hypothetical protein J6590_037752 [Homalodisca vitripennis]|nr:hypothetical protein J6590_037752 [Homalodisca vitripennis]